MKEDKIEPITSFYRKVVFADKVFDVNFQEIAKVLFNEVDRLHSIIKEVREYIETNKENTTQTLRFDKNKSYNTALLELLGILDKE